MKLGIIGLPGSGRTTIFEALTQNAFDTGNRSENRIAVVRVPDNRVDVLRNMYQPLKTVYAQVEFFLPGMPAQNVWNQVRDCNALIHVVRNFGYGVEEPELYKDFQNTDQEMILADLVVVENRIERIELDKKRGKKIDQSELPLLNESKKKLENEIPLRKSPDLASAHQLKGFAFVSAKPMLVLFNNQDEDDSLPDPGESSFDEDCMLIRGKLEQELAQMSEKEAEDFLAEFNITASARDRVIKRSYKLLGLISFFTIGKDEVRAWTIKNNTIAVDTAGAVHSDMKKGFIRAEVVSYDDLMDAGSYQEARKKGTVRLEGKTYPVQDGDIINFRFNV